MNLKLKIKIIENFGKQWVFAQSLGIDDSAVSKAITGAKVLSQDKKAEWAKALNCTVSDIFSTN
jgi:DNA-binding XRE family transcriptional regulator